MVAAGLVASAMIGCSAASAAALRACLALRDFASAFDAAFPLPFLWAFATWVLLAGLERECTRRVITRARSCAALGRRAASASMVRGRPVHPPGGGAELSWRRSR